MNIYYSNKPARIENTCAPHAHTQRDEATPWLNTIVFDGTWAGTLNAIEYYYTVLCEIMMRITFNICVSAVSPLPFKFSTQHNDKIIASRKKRVSAVDGLHCVGKPHTTVICVDKEMCSTPANRRYPIELVKIIILCSFDDNLRK